MQSYAEDINKKIQEELKNIKNLQFLMCGEKELDEINALVKVDGRLAKTLAKGSESTDKLAKILGVPIQDDDYIKEMKSRQETVVREHILCENTLLNNMTNSEQISMDMTSIIKDAED